MGFTTRRLLAGLVLATTMAVPAAAAQPRNLSFPPGFATYPLAAARGPGVPVHELWFSTRVDNPPSEPTFAWKVDAPPGYPACNTFTQAENQIFKISGTTTYASQIHLQIGTAAGCPPDAEEGGSDSFDGTITVTILMGAITCTVGTTGPLNGQCDATGAGSQQPKPTATAKPDAVRRAEKLAASLKKLDARLAWLQKRLAAGKRVTDQAFHKVTFDAYTSMDTDVALSLPKGWARAFLKLEDAVQVLDGTDRTSLFGNATPRGDLRAAAASLKHSSAKPSADARYAIQQFGRIADKLDAGPSPGTGGAADDRKAARALLKIAATHWPHVAGLHADTVLRTLGEMHVQFQKLNPVTRDRPRGKVAAARVGRMRTALDRIRKAAEKASLPPAP